MKTTPLLFFFLLMICTLISFDVFSQKQQSVIKGRVFINDDNAANVSIWLKKQKKIVLTDNNGNFKFQNLPALKDTLIISSVESEMYEIPVNIESNGILNLGNIYLTAAASRLQNVEVTGRISRLYKSDYSFIGTKTQNALKDIPQSVSVITKELIKDKMQFTLKDAADEASGVNQYSGYDEYTIRGFRAENPRCINGLRGYNTTYTSSMLVNIERIEIIKGPSASLYGNCDPGGTINLVTKKPLQNKEREINISAGSWNHYRAEGDITGPLNKNKTLLYRFNAGYDNSKSFRQNFFSKSYQLAPSLSFIPNDKIQINIDFSLSHINTILDRGQPGFKNDLTLKSTPISITASQPGDYLHETDFATSVLFSYKLSKVIAFNSGYLNYISHQGAAGHGIQSYITNDSVNLYYSNWKYHTSTNTLTDYFTFHFNTGKINHQFLAGYDYIMSNVNLNQNYFEFADQFGAGSGIVGTLSLKNPQYFSRETKTFELSDYNSENADVEASAYHTQGIYIQEQINYNKWKLLLGARQEFYRSGDSDDSARAMTENIFLPRVGLVFDLQSNVSLYATYNKGFDPFEASSVTQVFDSPFKPVLSELIEVGAKGNFFHNKLSASLALYQLTLKNVAVNANNISNPDLFIQQGKDRSRGIEAEANGNIIPNLSIAASYSYCVAKVLQSKIISQEGTILENAPRNSSSSWIKYTFNKGTLKGLGITLGHEQASIRNTLQTGLTLPGYIIINAGLQYSFSHFNIAANLSNITNKTYWLSAYNNISKWPGTSRNFMINIGYSF